MLAEQAARIRKADNRARYNELALMDWLDKADTEASEDIARMERE